MITVIGHINTGNNNYYNEYLVVATHAIYTPFTKLEML